MVMAEVKVIATYTLFNQQPVTDHMPPVQVFNPERWMADTGQKPDFLLFRQLTIPNFHGKLSSCRSMRK